MEKDQREVIDMDSSYVANDSDTLVEFEPQLLKEAFDRFTEASSKLQEKYELVVAEGEALRAQLKEKEEAIRRAEKLAALGETAAAIAHEIRNPLGSIKLFLSLLKEDVLDRPETVELVEQINKSVGMLEYVVSNILQFAREHKQTDFTPVNLHALLKEQLMQLTIGHTEVVVNSSMEGNPFILASEHGLRQVFHNLILNALQALQYKGILTVGAYENHQGDLVVNIRDNGPGIQEEIIGRIFDPFITSKNEGTGLGLAIVSQILNQHNCEISVANNNGADFQLVFSRGDRN